MTGVVLPFAAIAALLLAALVVWKPVLPVVLLGLLAPLGLTQLPGSVDLVTVLSALLIATAAWQYLLSGSPLVPVSWAAFGACVWTVGIVASVTFSADPGRAAILGTWQILAAWMAVGIAQLVDTPQRVKAVSVAVLIGATITAASGLAGGLDLQEAYGAAVVQGRAVGVFSQPNEYGLYCAMVGAFSLGVASMSRGYLRYLGALCSVASIAGLATSFSRGAWVGAATAALVMAILIPQTRRVQAVALICVVSALAAVSVIVPYWRLPGLLASRVLSVFTAEANPYDNRPALLVEGLRQWAERPILGVGPNMYPVESRTLLSETRTLEGQHAHNLIITTGAEQGLIGLLALTLFIVAVVSAARTARRLITGAHSTNPNTIPIGAAVTLSSVGALVVIMAAGLVDYPLRNALTRSTAWMFIGLALAGQRCLENTSLASSRQREADEHVITS